MCSTRNAMHRFGSRAAVVALATPFLFLFPVTGCQRIQPNRAVALSDEPLVVDEAMQIREWDRQTAHYASGATVAGDTRLRLEPKYDDRRNYAADPLIGVTNFVLIPFTYVRTPPRTTVVHRGAVTPPTHTAMPQTRVIE